MKYKLSIRVSIRPENTYSGGLEIIEELDIDAKGFMEIAKILSQFHELAEALAKKR